MDFRVLWTCLINLYEKKFIYIISLYLIERKEKLQNFMSIVDFSFERDFAVLETPNLQIALLTHPSRARRDNIFTVIG